MSRPARSADPLAARSGPGHLQGAADPVDTASTASGGSPPQRPVGLHGLFASFAAAANGLGIAWQRGRNFRIQVAAGYAAVVLSSWLRLPVGEITAIAVAAGLVLATETLNTAVEVLVDLVTRAYHPLARTAKDLAAGAVLLTTVAAIVVALLALLPRAADIPAALQRVWSAAPGRVLLAAAVQLVLVVAAVRFRSPEP